jgi:hypothetical protein
METGKLLTSLLFIVVAIAAIIVYISISWQSFPKECKTLLVGNSYSVLGSLKACVDNCWSKHDFGGDVYSDDCYVVSINSTNTLSRDRMEGYLNKPANTKVYFESLEKNVEHKIKIRYNSTGKEISLVLFEAI